MSRNPRVIIIGAGVSGIAAAKNLIEHGFSNITILEASNRIGGRIKSVDFQESTIDVGAQWCHGEKGNIVYELVKDLNLLEASSNTYRDLTFYDSSGKQMDKQLTDKLFHAFGSISEDEEGLEDNQGSLGEYIIRRYNEYTLKEFEGSKEHETVASCMLDWFHKLILCYDSSPTWFNISAQGHYSYEECEGNQLLQWKDRGFHIILDVLMNEYPDKSNSLHITNQIEFEKEAHAIHWNDSNERTIPKQILVNCTDGSSYKADHVIVTASLGVLKETYKSLFIPELPKYKQRAIEGLSIGTVNKVFLKFPTKFWPDDCPGFSLVWSKDDAANILNEFPYGPSHDGKSWLEDVFGFYVIDSDPKTLMGWIVGRLAHDVEHLPDEVVLDGCMYLLKKFLGDIYDIPMPENVLCSRWFTNPLFRGCYSYRSIETDSKNTSAEDLARSIWKDGTLRLLFAGEATHSKYYSTVHGAIESGFREATRIINLYTNADVKKYRIAIVGAGMAGLGAASALLEAGITDIIVLEAQNQAGGRIKTINANGGVIEMGAQWLHGSDNVLFKIAHGNDLILPEKSLEGLGAYVRDDGFIFDDFLVKKVNFEIGQILEDCEKFVDTVVHPESCGDYLERRYSKIIHECDVSDAVKEMKWELYDWHVRFQLIDNSCKDLREISAKDWGKYSCLAKDGQEYLNIRNGYKSLLDVIVKSFPDGVLTLSMPVVKISYADDTIKLTCENGSSILADHVIVTSSVGVLQDGLIKFEPELPKILSTTISKMGFHGIGKVVLSFKEKWWHTEGFQLIWRRGTAINEERSWTRYLTGFDVVLNQPDLLLGWVGGDGVEIMEKLSEEDVGKHCVDLLRTFLKNDTIPYPIKVYRSTWTTCPWVRGGYSYTTPACDQSGIGPSTLCEPVVVNGVPKVLFAGEAAHPNHFSTTHGAFESGERQARLLLKHYKKSKL